LSTLLQAYNSPDLVADELSNATNASLNSILTTVNDLQNPSITITEEVVDVLGDPKVIDMMRASSPQVKNVAVESAHEFFNNNFSQVSDQIQGFLQGTTILAEPSDLSRFDESGTVETQRALLLDDVVTINTDGVEKSGTIRFLIEDRPGLNLQRIGRAKLQTQLDNYAEMLSDGLRAQAHLDASRLSTQENFVAPDYVEIYNILSGNGVREGSWGLPFSNILPPLE
jgi:hypothetical protein